MKDKYRSLCAFGIKVGSSGSCLACLSCMGNEGEAASKAAIAFSSLLLQITSTQEGEYAVKKEMLLKIRIVFVSAITS